MSTAPSNPRTREIEFKYAVDNAGAFKQLIAYLGLPESLLNTGVLQVNHFFDTRTLSLHAAGCSVRLREQKGEYKLTVKEDARTGAVAASLSNRAEYETAIHAVSAQEFLSNQQLPLRQLKEALKPHREAITAILSRCAIEDDLSYVGNFRNTRIQLPVTLSADNQRYEVIMEFDSSEYPGCQPACEIEVEIPSEKNAVCIQKALEQLLENAGVTWQTSTNKAARFFTALADR